MAVENTILGLVKGLSRFGEELGEEGIKDAANGLYKSMSGESAKFLDNFSEDHISKMVSHDIDTVGAKSFKDYKEATSIYGDNEKSTNDLKGVAKYLNIKTVGETAEDAAVEREIKNSTMYPSRFPSKSGFSAEDMETEVRRRKKEYSQREQSPEYEVNQTRIDNTFHNADARTIKDAAGEPVYLNSNSPMIGKIDEQIKNQQAKVQKKADEISNKYKTNTVESKINSKTKGNPVVAQQIDRITKIKNAQMDALEKAGGDQEKLKALAEQHGVKSDGDIDPVAIRNAINSKYQQNLQAGPSMMDKVWGNKVPQKVGGVATTAWLVSSMAASRGQQSNAQLYGQQTPYQQ